MRPWNLASLCFERYAQGVYRLKEVPRLFCSISLADLVICLCLFLTNNVLTSMNKTWNQSYHTAHRLLLWCPATAPLRGGSSLRDVPIGTIQIKFSLTPSIWVPLQLMWQHKYCWNHIYYSITTLPVFIDDQLSKQLLFFSLGHSHNSVRAILGKAMM